MNPPPVTTAPGRNGMQYLPTNMGIRYGTAPGRKGPKNGAYVHSRKNLRAYKGYAYPNTNIIENFDENGYRSGFSLRNGVQNKRTPAQIEYNMKMEMNNAARQQGPPKTVGPQERRGGRRTRRSKNRKTRKMTKRRR